MRLGLTLIISPKWGHCGLWMSGHFIPASRSCCSVSDQKSLFFSQIALPHLVFVFGFVFFCCEYFECEMVWAFHLASCEWVCSQSPDFLVPHVLQSDSWESATCSSFLLFFFCLLDDERAIVDTQICKVKLGVSSSPEPVLQFEWLQSSVISSQMTVTLVSKPTNAFALLLWCHCPKPHSCVWPHWLGMKEDWEEEDGVFVFHPEQFTDEWRGVGFAWVWQTPVSFSAAFLACVTELQGVLTEGTTPREETSSICPRPRSGGCCCCSSWLDDSIRSLLSWRFGTSFVGYVIK